MNAADSIRQISTLFSAGRYAEAMQACESALARGYNDSRIFYLYGITCYKAGDLEKSAVQFRNAVAARPDDHESRYNLGVACAELGRYDEAVAAYRSLLEHSPSHIKALPNLAQALIKSGHYDDGIAMFHRALAATPQDASTAALLMEFECLNLPMHERVAACDRALAMPSLPPGTRHTALLYRATAEWAAGDTDALRSSLAQANAIPPQPGDQGYANMVVYKTFLTRLLEYRLANPSLYDGTGATLPIVGDSHSLTYAGVVVTLGGVAHRVDSHLIVGAQARHIASTGPEVRRDALARHIDRLPAGSTLLCAFGEIDCRLNHGILPYCQKTGQDPETVAADTAARYVSALTAMAAKKSIHLLFLSVPAPHPASGQRQHIIRAFNHALAQHADAADHRTVDLYTPTLGANGVSHGNLHIDNYHLNPGALRDVMTV